MLSLTPAPAYEGTFYTSSPADPIKMKAPPKAIPLSTLINKRTKIVDDERLFSREVSLRDFEDYGMGQ